MRGHTAGKECRGPWGLLSVTSRNLAFKGNNWMLGFFPKCPPDTLSLGIEASLSLEDTFGIEKALARAIRAARWGRIAGQDSGSHLKEGIDWTVPRSIVKAPQLCFYRTAWQGALLTPAKGSPMCPTCKVQVDLQHILYDCTWWGSQKIALPKHWAEIRKRLPYPSLWCRGLMPGIATDHPQYEYGEGSIVRTGLWLSQPKICAQGLFFGTDASGGPGSKDPRTRIVTWSVIAGSWGPEGFVTLGSLSGVEPPGTSVIQGEAKALAQLLKNTEGEAQVAVDSKGAISQQESKVQKSNHYPAWYGCFPDRGGLTCHWLSSHTTLESFLADHGESSSWQWHANQAADALCGRRALEAFSQQHVAWVARADKLCLEVNRFLAARVTTILTADPPPPAMRVLQKKDRNGGRHPSAQHKPKAPQPRPAADGGKNKKQRMEDMVAGSFFSKGSPV